MEGPSNRCPDNKPCIFQLAKDSGPKTPGASETVESSSEEPTSLEDEPDEEESVVEVHEAPEEPSSKPRARPRSASDAACRELPVAFALCAAELPVADAAEAACDDTTLTHNDCSQASVPSRVLPFALSRPAPVPPPTLPN